VKGRPTERQAALAARQLHYHRVRLRWIEDKVGENEALLLSYLTHLDTGAVVLPGGYMVSGGHASPGRRPWREVSISHATGRRPGLRRAGVWPMLRRRRPRRRA
jgi:hypothetical protein